MTSPDWPWMASSLSGFARSSAIVETPSVFIAFTPSASAALAGRMRPICSPIQPPLCAMARTKRPLACGEPTSAPTMMAPADSPAMVTLLGSPPNAAMLRFTHCSIAMASIIP